jgi:hypothetical protein
MKYTQIEPTDLSIDIKTLVANSDKNLEHLDKIDKKAKEKSEILHRYFTETVADGRAFYQVVRLKKIFV